MGRCWLHACRETFGFAMHLSSQQLSFSAFTIDEIATNEFIVIDLLFMFAVCWVGTRLDPNLQTSVPQGAGHNSTYTQYREGFVAFDPPQGRIHEENELKRLQVAIYLEQEEKSRSSNQYQAGSDAEASSGFSRSIRFLGGFGNGVSSALSSRLGDYQITGGLRNDGSVGIGVDGSGTQTNDTSSHASAGISAVGGIAIILLGVQDHRATNGVLQGEL